MSESESVRILQNWKMSETFRTGKCHNNKISFFWHIQYLILTFSDSDIFRFWKILTFSDSDIFWFWKILTFSDSDVFRFWRILTFSDSDVFWFWRILTFSDSDKFQFWHFPDLTKNGFWRFQILTCSALPFLSFIKKGLNFWFERLLNSPHCFDPFVFILAPLAGLFWL